jgi:ATP-dependent RNA helicase DeaD
MKDTMENFDTLGLPRALTQALVRLKFTTPTPIQAAAIPHALEGKDILGSAQTGTGKTAAFGIPLIAHLLKNPNACALVMTPTRELAVQVSGLLEQLLGEGSGIRSALIIGGESMGKQLRQLQNRPRLIVGTPGRINDHLARRTLKFATTDFLVLDETDRMLDMGFGVQIYQILSHMPAKRQTLLFSATLPANIVKLSGKYMTDPLRVSVGETHLPIERIKQESIMLKEEEKFDQLLVQLQQRQGSILVFVKTKFGAEKMAKKLRSINYAADAIHGDLRQRERDKAINAFRSKQTRIMVATDIAARGLDIPHIEHVINHDMPQCPEDYIHRIGRTARNGAEGEALNLITGADRKKWLAIQRLLNPGQKPEPFAGEARGSRKPFNKNKRFRPQHRSGKPGQRRAMPKAA